MSPSWESWKGWINLQWPLPQQRNMQRITVSRLTWNARLRTKRWNININISWMTIFFFFRVSKMFLIKQSKLPWTRIISKDVNHSVNFCSIFKKRCSSKLMKLPNYRSQLVPQVGFVLASIRLDRWNDLSGLQWFMCIVRLIGIRIVSSRSRRFIEHFPKKQTRKMRSVLCVLLFSPCLLLNCDGASVENIYRSYANKMFGGNPSCITITDVSSAYSAEGKHFYLQFHRFW